MSLSPGTHLGSYEVLSPIGAGGMGEVYRARDTKLGRDVAIKVLPEAFASDHDRMVRFQREAHLLASLNHPHIATIHGLEESDSVRALVMELVEGPTLAERIAQGAIPIEEAPGRAGDETLIERGPYHPTANGRQVATCASDGRLSFRRRGGSGTRRHSGRRLRGPIP